MLAENQEKKALLQRQGYEHKPLSYAARFARLSAGSHRDFDSERKPSVSDDGVRRYDGPARDEESF